MLDGKEDRGHDGIVGGSLRFSGRDRLAYAARAGADVVLIDGKEEKTYRPGEKAGLTLSPDSKRIAYGSKISNKRRVVLNQDEGRPYDDILGPPVFSPDSKRLAYAAAVQENAVAVIDGKESKAYEAVEALVFSPDSKRAAYRAKSGGRERVVAGGKEGKEHDSVVFGPFFSPDSKRLHYVGRKGAELHLIEEDAK